MPKAIVDQLRLDDEVELLVGDQRLVIVPAARARAGWAEAVSALGADPATELDAAASTRFDEAEWHW